MVQRLTYRRRHSYATRSNKVRKVKTPGEGAGAGGYELTVIQNDVARRP